MTDIEAFSAAYRTWLDEAEQAMSACMFRCTLLHGRSLQLGWAILWVGITFFCVSKLSTIVEYLVG